MPPTFPTIHLPTTRRTSPALSSRSSDEDEPRPATGAHTSSYYDHYGDHRYGSPKTSPSNTSTNRSNFAAMTTPNQAPGLRYPSNKKTIYDRNLNRSKNGELSRAAFAYLFVEMIAYAQRHVNDIATLEKRLNTQGYPLGVRLLDLLLSRTSNPLASIRPTRILPLLQFIAQTLWRHLFARPADALERSESDASQYMLFDNDPMVNQYISLPKEMRGLNCAAFVAGIIEGVCDGAGFPTDGVSAHNVDREEGEGKEGPKKSLWPGKTVFLIKFKPEVLEREEILEKGGR